jgi:hypothetical protein
MSVPIIWHAVTSQKIRYLQQNVCENRRSRAWNLFIYLFIYLLCVNVYLFNDAASSTGYTASSGLMVG